MSCFSVGNQFSRFLWINTQNVVGMYLFRQDVKCFTNLAISMRLRDYRKKEILCYFLQFHHKRISIPLTMVLRYNHCVLISVVPAK